ncbi:MAG TPA: Gfo/Idh/MocA family oxidoreductase [Caldilineaceae bacterium]|nr:Gfo/Idh/MocA family oxidoreductase [Caldilineaceae bacterium]
MSDARKRWRVGFIGAGTIVQRGHIPAFGRLPNTEAVAICDVNEARAKAVAAEAGIPHVYADYERMLAEVQPDIVVVATPNVYHQQQSYAALEAGAHVLCEKPLALTYADAKAMFETAARVGRTLTVGTHYRWSMPMRAAKAHVDAGFFGEIYAARTVWQRRSGIPGYGSWFTNKDLAGGGSLLDIGVHALDRALYLMNYPMPVTVSGVSYAKFGPRGLGLGSWGMDILPPTADARYDVDDLSWGFVRFANGAALQFQVAWANALPEQVITELYGTDGGAAVGHRDTLDLYTLLNGQQAKIQVDIPPDPVGSYPRLIENFVRYLDGDPTAEIVTPAQALTSVAIVDGILRSAESGHEIAIPEETPVSALPAAEPAPNGASAPEPATPEI